LRHHWHYKKETQVKNGGKLVTEERQTQEELNDQMLVRREKMEKLREEGIDPFGKRFERTHNSAELHELFDQRNKEELAEMTLSESIA
jgi:lysyl-tRNA synthetase class 2